MPIQSESGRDHGVRHSSVICTRDNSAVYQWKLEQVLDIRSNILETGIFSAGEWKWRLRLAMNYGFRDKDYLAMHLVSENELPIDVWFKATSVNHVTNTADHMRGSSFNFVSADALGFFDFIDIDLLNEDDCITITAEILVLRANDEDIFPDPISLDRDVKVHLLREEDIKQHLDYVARYGLFGSAVPTEYSFGGRAPLHHVAKTLCEDLSNVRLWCTRQLPDGSLEMPFSLDTLPLKHLTLADLIDHLEQNDISLKFFAQDISTDTRPVDFHSRLLFLKLMEEEDMEMIYAGCITIDGRTSWQRVINAIRSKAEDDGYEIDEDYPASQLYLEVDQPTVKKIDPNLTLEENGVISGSVLVLRTDRDENENVPAISFEQMLLRLYIDALMIDDGLTEAVGEEEGDTNEQQSAETECVVCLDKPQTSGFVHNNKSHRCVCKDCAKLYVGPNKRCPVCMEPIVHVVYDYF